jgi:hypothetical protein
MPSRTTKSGDPRKRAAAKTTAPKPQNDKYAPTHWGSGGEQYIDLTVPSGQLCQVRRPGVEGLLKAGILHNLDMLTPLIAKQQAVVEGKAKPDSVEADLAELAKDPEKVFEMMHLLDRVVTYVVVQPTIEMTPNDPTSRDNSKIYADMVELDDKLYILNYAVGGSKDLERFREESDATLGGVQGHLADAGAPQ